MAFRLLLLLLSLQECICQISPTPPPTRPDETGIPTTDPTSFPTGVPSPQPTNRPSHSPLFPGFTHSPTDDPTMRTTTSFEPSTSNPSTERPTTEPSPDPTELTIEPTLSPTRPPLPGGQTYSPSPGPTRTDETGIPTDDPTSFPTFDPTLPTDEPTNAPTPAPSISPTNSPTFNLCCLCLDVRDTPGCPQDEICASVVCNDPDAGNPDCCNVVWNSVCTEAAEFICFNFVEPTKNPTHSPSFFPTEDPTVAPSPSPTSSPTKKPTNDPTRSPTFSPTFPSQNPTRNPTSSPSMSPTHAPLGDGITRSPTVDPTVMPTKTPSINPTANPTKSPSISPSANPTLSPSPSPTDAPSPNPSPSPTPSPSVSPTLDPTNDPTQNPSLFPTLSPTHAPLTGNETLPPTGDPTKAPVLFTFPPTSSESGCGECEKYYTNLTKIDIIDNGGSESEESESSESSSVSDSGSKTWWKRRYKKDSSSEGSRRRWRRKRRKKGWYRRRMYHDETVQRQIERRRRRRLSSCNDNVQGSGWHNHDWKVSSDSDDNENDKLNEVCLYYAVNKYEPDCGELSALFLPLCNNSQNVKSSELNAIIQKIEPNTLSAQGVELFDSIGILITFNAQFVNEFVLCLSNVSVNDDYYDINKVTTANRAAFRVDNVFEECSNNDGLPCLDFVFPVICDKECECEKSIDSISIQYVGIDTAKFIIFYFGDSDHIICIFADVKQGDEVTCSAKSSMYSYFGDSTKFLIVYEDESQCHGSFDTSCSTNIYHTFGDGECVDIKVIEWMDINENVCNDDADSDSLSYSISDSDDYNAENALLDNNLVTGITAESYYGFIKHWRTEIIIIVSVLMILIVFGCICLVYSTRFYQKYRMQTKSASLITDRTDTNINGQRRRKRVKRKRKKKKKDQNLDGFYSVDCKGGDE